MRVGFTFSTGREFREKEVVRPEPKCPIPDVGDQPLLCF